MPKSSIERLPNAATSVVLPGGETFTAVNRRTEYLRKISDLSRRLRGSYAAANVGAGFDATKKGRQDTLRALTCRAGIIPINLVQTPGATSTHGYIQAYPPARSASDTITTTPGTTFNVGDNAYDNTFAGTGVQDVTAVSALDASATGAARITIA